MRIRGTTRLLGLIGDPVAHSLSPLMHNAALAELQQDWVYLPFPIKADQLATGLAGLAAVGVQGLNVTIPHKQAVIPFLTEISPQAQAVGAVNTLYRSEQGWSGTNTDIEGFLSPLRIQAWESSTVTILGSGGSARAAIAGCVQLGFARIRVVGRSVETLVGLQKNWPQISLAGWEELPQCLPHSQLLVNTTPIGMHKAGGSDPASPLTLAELHQLPLGATVYDLIYTPNPTQLLKLAATAGYATLDGLEMLVQQGAAALGLWLNGSEIPIDVMRQAARQGLSL